MSARQKIREAFSSAKPLSKVINVFGVDIELRQPTLSAILDAQSEPDRKWAIAQMIINYSYVPGTTEKAFEAADKDMLMNIPFGGEMNKINQAIEALTGIDMKAQETAVKNSGNTQDASTPIH